MKRSFYRGCYEYFNFLPSISARMLNVPDKRDTLCYGVDIEILWLRAGQALNNFDGSREGFVVIFYQIYSPSFGISNEFSLIIANCILNLLCKEV